MGGHQAPKSRNLETETGTSAFPGSNAHLGLSVECETTARRRSRVGEISFGACEENLEPELSARQWFKQPKVVRSRQRPR